MLSSANRALVLRDQALPGLALLLDPPALLGLLRERWPELVLSSLEPSYLRYKAGTSCLAGFRLEANGKPTWLTFTARRRDASDKMDKSLLKSGLPGPFGAGRALFAELAVTMASFPNDRALKRLWRVAEPHAHRPLLGKLSLPRDGSIEALRYRPERRFVARVSQDGAPLALLKLHAPEVFVRARFSASAFTCDGSLVIPRLIGSSARHGAVASEWLAGAVAKTDAATAKRIGAALATLHRQDALGLALMTRRDQRASALAMAEDITALLPELAARAASLADRIAQALESDAPPVALHGDCHIDQILDLGEAIALIDFDEATRGPAAWDFGNLIAHLVLADPGCEPAFNAALLGGYRAAGGTVTERDVAAQTALGLLRLATHPFREQQADWPAAIAAILTLAEAACPAPASSVPAIAAPLDPALPLLGAALDPLRAASAFAEAGLAVRVESAQLVRHKPGRRCLIAYELADRTGRRFKAFGKLRAKGADSRVFALQQELWRDGFGPAGWAEVRVPEPLALVPSLGLWLQAAVPGEAFAVETCPPEQAAKAITALHGARVRPLKRHLIADELAILETRLEALAQRRPDWTDRLRQLLGFARQLAAQVQPVALRPIHRDFYHDHLLCVGPDYHLIDLDLICLGDPAVDIGNFNAHLSEQALREHGDPHRFAWWQARFAGAACRNPHGARHANNRTYEYLSLLRLTEIAERMPERRTSAEPLLALCESLAQAPPIHFRSPT